MATKTKDDLTEMRRRYALACDAVSTSYDEAEADRRFVNVPGEQWDQKLKARRGDRPTYEFPKLETHCRQVINEMRQGRPQGKVRGMEESDKGLAELMNGICRDIEARSNADQAYDIAYECAVEGGLGHWRIVTDYRSQDDFELDIFVKPIRNPFSVKWDSASIELDRSDAECCFVEDLISKASFERQYPKADLKSWESDKDCEKFREKDQVKVCEYFEKRPSKRTLIQLDDGRVLYADELGDDWEALLAAQGRQVIQQREVDSHKIYSRLTNGYEWLTDDHEWPTKYIPIIPVWGHIRCIDGEDKWKGMVRSNKDQQRLHNVHRTAAIEAVAKAPKAPFIVKNKWIKGLETFWNKANAEDFPYLPVNDEADGIPIRAQQAEIPAALIQLAALDNEDIKASTGQFNASLGATSNETSGRAINARKQQGATATFNYTDNLAYAIRRTYVILCDMIPKVYDTKRVVRVLGEDGGEKWKTLYEEVADPETGETRTLNDISKGKYDIAVTVGPSYATQRMETADMMSQLLAQIGPAFPPIAPLLANYIVKSLDGPGAEELGEHVRKLLVGQGLMPPEEGDNPPQPQQPNPKDVAAAQKDEATVGKLQAETESIQIDNAVKVASLPPMPPPMFDPLMTPEQPPQGGFSLGGDQLPMG
ncbi:MAG: portal protein [Stenotrophomonas sp.]